MKRIIPIICAIIIICCSGCGSKRLNESEQFICSTISNNFQQTKSIEIKSGIVSSDRAYLTIEYIDSSNNSITGQYKLTENSVEEISSIVGEKPTNIARYNEMSTMIDDDLDYSKISEHLNK